MNNSIPSEYADMYYIRSLDLVPKKLSESPFTLTIDECRTLYKKGLLFNNRMDACRVRNAMWSGMVSAVIKSKGIEFVNIEFKRPLCPQSEPFLDIP